MMHFLVFLLGRFLATALFTSSVVVVIVGGGEPGVFPLPRVGLVGLAALRRCIVSVFQLDVLLRFSLKELGVDEKNIEDV